MSNSQHISILYNGVDLFYPQPVPFIGINEENIYYGELWAKREQYILNGQITGCSMDIIYAAQQKLLSGLAQNYKSLQIYQFENNISGLIHQKDLVQIESIKFDSSRWMGILPYTLSLSCYPSGYFSGAYGILDPSDIWTYKENNDYSSQITHIISCKGLNTSDSINNSIDNAKNWALNNRGITTSQSPILIENLYTGNMCLISSNEEINRINGTYSITDNYISDLARTGYGVLRYNTTFESGNEKINVTLNGSVRGCGGNITALRQTFSGLDKAATAAISYQKTFNRNDLNATPLNYSIDENPLIPIINFNYSYDNDNSPESVYDYEVRLSSGTNILVGVNGNITSRGGDLLSKITRSKNYANTLNLYNIVTPFYNDFYPYFQNYPLNSKPISSGISINEFNADVVLSAEFSNQEFISDALISFDYTLNFQPSVQKIDSKPTLLGSVGYSTVDLGYTNRAILGINGNAVISKSYSSSDGIAAIKTKCQNLCFQYAKQQNIILEINEVNVSRFDQHIISFNFAWSFDSTTINPNYSTISQLTV